MSQAQVLADAPYVRSVFGALKLSTAGLVAVGPHCAQLKIRCRIGDWNHQSGNRAMIICKKWCKDLGSYYWYLASWQGKCARHGFGAHAYTEKKIVCKRDQFPDLYLIPCLLRAGLGGRWLVCETGLATQVFFFLLPYYLGLNIWSARRQLQRFLRARQRVDLFKISLCYHNYMRSI